MDPSRRALFGFLRRTVEDDASERDGAPSIDMPPPPPRDDLPSAVARIIRWVDFEPTRDVALLRPPGAVEEPAFLAKCTRCGDCAPACPHGAITFAPDRMEGAAGTPIVDPNVQACLMCEDMPCARACKPDVLRSDLPVAMGTAEIETFDCLNGIGSFCSTCVERCPVPGAMRMEDGRPVVDPSACTGCGLCQHVCPAPRNAIRVRPARSRPPWEQR